MVKQAYDEPGSDYKQEEFNSKDNAPVGNPSDPRGDYDPQTTPMGIKESPLDTPTQNPEEQGSRKDEGSAVKKNLKGAEEKPESYNPAGDKDAKEVDPEDLKDEEQDSGFYTAEEPKRQRSRNFFKNHRKATTIVGFLGFGVVGGGIALFLSLLPLKIEHMVDNLQSRFFSTTQVAVSEEAANMVQNYMVQWVLPGYRNCGSTVKKGCVALEFGNSGPVHNLYQAFKKNRIENKLAEKGIYLEYRKLSDTWVLHSPGLPRDGKNVGRDGKGIRQAFSESNEARTAFNASIKNEFGWHHALFRFQSDRMASNHYGTRRCIIACFIRDPVGNKIAEKKLAAKLYLTQRVLTPRTETLGIALECLITNCAATDNQPTGSDENNGAPRSQYNTDVVEALNKYSASTLSPQALNQALDQYKDMEEEGFSRYVIVKGLSAVPWISEAAAGRAANAIPIVGWVNLAAQIVNAGNDAKGNFLKFRYVTNAAAAINLYMLYRVYADECHTGQCDATELGSFTTALAPGNHGAKTDPIVGGTAGAEQAPLYGHLMDGKPASQSAVTTASAGSLLSGKASAASASGVINDYVCNDGSPISANALVCPEEFLGGGNSLANGIHAFLNMPGMNVITLMAQGWHATVGQVFDFAGGIVGDAFSTAMKPINAACDVPVIGTVTTLGYCGARDLAQKNLPKIVQAVTTALIPNPFSSNMSGARTFDMMAAGADALGNDIAQNLIGGQVLSPAQVADIRNKQEAENQREFAEQPLFARIFDTDSRYSLTSKVAMEIPFGTQAATQSGMATMLNPLGALSKSFGSIFSNKASAASQPEEDPFGITQYGYVYVPEDPDAYWQANCTDDPATGYQKDNSWNEEAAGEENADPNTGQPMNKTTNPCLLIKTTVGALGAKLDSSLLTEDQRAGVGLGSGGGDDSGSSGSSVSGDAKDLAKEILNNNKISKTGRYVTEDLTHTTNGQPAYADVTISIKILQFLAELGQTTPYTITSITGAGCGHSNDTCVTAGGSSNHYIGKAVDFGCPFDEAKGDEIAKKYGLMAQNERCENTPGNEHSHFSPDGY